MISNLGNARRDWIWQPSPVTRVLANVPDALLRTGDIRHGIIGF